VVVTAGTLVASVTAFLVGLLWPGGHEPAGPLDFQGFAHVGQLAFDDTSATTLAAVQGERGYAAWEQSGNLRVVAFDVTTGAEHWRQTVSGAPRWGRLIASPHVLLVLAHETDPSVSRKLFVRDPRTGAERWDIDVHGGDHLFFNDRTLGWFDRRGQALRGFELVTGEQRWSHPVDGTAHATEVTTVAELARPTGPSGVADPLGADHRIVLVTPDRTVRVIEGYDGGVLTERHNVAGPNDLLLPYEDRLFVAAQERGYRVESYNLTDLAEPPRAIYTASDLERIPDELAPCGTDRICVLDTLAFDQETAVVSAVDVVDGGALWQQEVPAAQRLLPVGDWLAVATTVDFADHVVILDEQGEPRHNQAGEAVRLNDGNLLLVDAEWDNAAGFPVAQGEGTPLGPVPEVEPLSCAWNERQLVCAGPDAVDIWRFAGD
jgi:outer membrane protein assembly factor BamB